MRGAARKDTSQTAIVAALRSVGACVEILNNKDLGDLLVAFRSFTIVMECKSPEQPKSKRKLRLGQEAFRVRWTAAGGNHARVETVDEALRAIGLEPR